MKISTLMLEEVLIAHFSFLDLTLSELFNSLALIFITPPPPPRPPLAIFRDGFSDFSMLMFFV